MKIEHIEKLEKINKNRKDSDGYLAKKNEVYIKKENLFDLIRFGNRRYRSFDKYFGEGILEKEAELIKRAFELEEEDYQKTKKLAKIEAVNIITDEDLI